jgi:hypothetical protein
MICRPDCWDKKTFLKKLLGFIEGSDQNKNISQLMVFFGLDQSAVENIMAQQCFF